MHARFDCSRGQPTPQSGDDNVHGGVHIDAQVAGQEVDSTPSELIPAECFARVRGRIPVTAERRGAEVEASLIAPGPEGPAGYRGVKRPHVEVLDSRAPCSRVREPVGIQIVQRCSLSKDYGDPAAGPCRQVATPGRWPGEIVVLLVGKRTKTPQVGSAEQNRRSSAAAAGDLFGGHPVIITPKSS